MDHSEDDKRFCVYVLKDVDGNVRYVGSGTERRPGLKQRSNNKELLAVITDLTYEILQKGLSKDESIEIEKELYDKYKDSGLLFNKVRPSGVNGIDYDLVNKHFYYDETSPSFLRWKEPIGGGRYGKIMKRNVGDVAGSPNGEGYYQVRLFGIMYKIHRIIWVLCSGVSLKTNLVVDHIDRNKANNKIDNLRLVTQKQNMQNLEFDLERSNTGYANIYARDESNLIYALWKDNGKQKCKSFNYRKLFPDIEKELAKLKCIEIALWYKDEVARSLNLTNQS